MEEGIPLDRRTADTKPFEVEQKSPRFFCVNVVWGKLYVNFFTEYSIPSLLAPGNIPGIPNREISEFIIVTTDEDAARIRQSDIFERLSSTIKVVFIPIQIATDQHKYYEMSRGHSLAVSYIQRRGYAIFLAPDAIASDGM